MHRAGNIEISPAMGRLAGRLAVLLLPALYAPAAPADEGRHPCSEALSPACPEAPPAATLRGFVALDALRFDGRPIHEFSGLAWDEHTHTLYALSDRGILARMRPRFESRPPGGPDSDGAHGKTVEQLSGVEPIGAAVLLDEHGMPLKGPYRDSEGLALAADGTLLVSFERRPRICAYRPDGHHAGCGKPRHPALRDPQRYRGDNLGLEALAILPDGRMVTGPEAALRAADEATLYLYPEAGAPWTLRTHYTRGRLTGLATLPDGRLLVLERRKTPWPTYTPAAVHVYDPDSRQTFPVLYLDGNSDARRPGERWPVANFEGIAVRDAHHFFLISDDNAPLPGRALLLYVEWHHQR